MLFNAVDTLLGDPLISRAFHGQQPAEAIAYILNSDIHSAGDLTVKADNAAQLSATVSNTANSAASALYGANGTAVGLLLASNKVSSRAEAYIVHSTGFLTTAPGRQLIDITPSTRVTLHLTYGTTLGDCCRLGRTRRTSRS